MNSLFCREFIVNSVSGPRIHYLLRRYTTNSPSFTQVHYNFLSLLQIKYEFTWCSADSLWIIHFTNSKLIYFLFRESKWIHFLFHEFAIYFTKIQWIHCLFHDSTMILLSALQIHYLFREKTMNSLPFLLLQREFTIFFANPNFRES